MYKILKAEKLADKIFLKMCIRDRSKPCHSNQSGFEYIGRLLYRFGKEC